MIESSMIDAAIALWPIFALLGLAGIFVWPNLNLKGHRYFHNGRGSWGGPSADPIEDVRDRAEKAGVTIKIRHPDD